MPCEFEDLAVDIGSRAVLYVRWQIFQKAANTAKGAYKKKSDYIFHNICRMIAYKFDGVHVDEQQEYKKLSLLTGLERSALVSLEMEVLDAIDWRIRLIKTEMPPNSCNECVNSQ